jgi:hypothetical protein
MALDHLLPPDGLSSKGRLGRRSLKRILYSQMQFRNVFMIATGKEQPLMKFTVEAEPPSVYFNFRVKDSHATAAAFGLPSGFELSPMTPVVGDDPAPLLTLNVYRVSGIARGIRAEWSTYIRDRLGIPRYMVVAAQSATTSMDPIDIITKAGRVEHEHTGSTIRTVVDTGRGLFEGSIEVLGDAAEPRQATGEWVRSNDFIYWKNGVCDRTFYDAGLTSSPLEVVAPDRVEISHATEWTEFVEPDPQVVVFPDAIDFVIMPWLNIDMAPGS